MNGSLELPAAKLRRAVYHYQTLKEIHWGVDHRRRPVTCQQVDAEGLRYEFRVGEIEPLNSEVSLILGDAYHNLRSALDGLAFQLHVRRHRGTVPSDVIDNSGFPIRMNEWHIRSGAKKGQSIPTAEWREIRTLAGKERRAIEWLQPYKGWEHRWPRPRSQIGQLRAGLADINRFDIIDKHHQPHLAAAVLIAVGQPDFAREDFGFRQEPAFIPADGPLTPLESFAVVDRWSFTKRPPPRILDTHHGVVSGIGMEPDPGHRIDVLPNLGGSVWVVADVMGRFAKLFPPLAEPLVRAHDVAFVAG